MHQNNYTVYNDAVAMETAVKWKELPAPIKPRYLFGSNEQFPVDIMKWEADGSLRAFKGTGWDKDFEQRDNYEESSQDSIFRVEEWPMDSDHSAAIGQQERSRLRRRYLLRNGTIHSHCVLCLGWPQWRCRTEDGRFGFLLYLPGASDAS